VPRREKEPKYQAVKPPAKTYNASSLSAESRGAPRSRTEGSSRRRRRGRRAARAAAGIPIN